MFLNGSYGTIYVLSLFASKTFKQAKDELNKTRTRQFTNKNIVGTILWMFYLFVLVTMMFPYGNS